MPSRMEPTRITLARRVAGMTKAELAREVGVSPGTVVFWEDGVRDATSKLNLIVDALGKRGAVFPPEFFFGGEVPTTDPDGITFRKRYDATRRVRDRSAAAVDVVYGVLAPAVKQWLGHRYPEIDVPSLTGMRPEAAAATLRKHWGLTDGPLRNSVEQLEARGVRVYWLTDASPSLSAFCKRIDGEPVVILNSAKRDGCRSRFDACHELGHLVMHREVGILSDEPKKVEREADTFASAFLLPREPFLEDAPDVFDLDELFEVKRVWKVSVQAIVRRLYDLGVYSASQYEYAFRVMSAKGWRREPEPLAGPMEASKLHWMLCDKLECEDLRPDAFAGEVGLPWNVVEEMMPVLAVRQSHLAFGNLIDDSGPLGIGKATDPTLPYDD